MALVILERINKTLLFLLTLLQDKQSSIGEKMALSDYLHRDRILFVSGSTRDEVLKHLINHAENQGLVSSGESFLRAVLEREKIVSTAVGLSVAIPHAKCEASSDFFIVLGVHKEGVEWNSLDGSLVKIMFLVGGPEKERKKYLQLLSDLTSLIKNEELRQQILLSEDCEAVFQEIQTFLMQNNS